MAFTIAVAVAGMGLARLGPLRSCKAQQLLPCALQEVPFQPGCDCKDQLPLRRKPAGHEHTPTSQQLRSGAVCPPRGVGCISGGLG